MYLRVKTLKWFSVQQRMDSYPKSTTAGSALSLRAIRLLVPPVHLLSASMWQAAEKGNLMDYETLGEIVTSLTETVPELLDFRHKTQLILGLRAKMILEMCRNEQTAELQTIQPYLDKIQVPPPFTDGADVCVTDADVSKSNFHDLVHNLLRDPVRRAHFFQEVFPVEYGPKYDSALRRLMWEFLSRLQQLLPVPDIKQTASWLRAAPNILNECVESVCHSPHLETILQHHQKQGYLSNEGSLPLSTGNCIFSCLSFPSLVTSTKEQTNKEIHSAIVDHHVIYEDDVGMESIVVTDCAEVELGTSEHSRVGKESGIGDSTEPQKQLQNQPKLHDEHLGRQLELVCKEEPEEIRGAGVQLVPEDGSQQNTEVEVLCEETSAVCEDVKSTGEELKRIYKEVEIVENLKTESGMSGQTKEDTQSSLLAENTQKEERTFQKEASERNDTTEAVCYPATETKREGSKIALEEAERKDPMTSCQQHTSCLYRQDITSSLSVPLTRSERLLRRKGLLQQSAERQSVLDEAKVTRTVPSKLPPEASKKRKNIDNISYSPVKTPIQGLKGKMAEPSLVFASANLRCAENKKRQSPGDVGPDPPPSEPAHPETSISQPQKHFPSITLHTLERSSGKKTRSKTCPVCGKTFTRATDMRRHQISHTGERPYTCTQCGKSFLYSFDLKRHQRKGTGSSPFQCCVCGEGYDQEEVLKTHCSVTHSSDTTALSNDTDNKFTAVGINSGEDICNNKGQHKCLKCHMTFSQASQMRHHLQVHSKDDPLRCSQCWKKYPNSDALSRHMQTHNKGQKFQCAMCKMSFTQFICLRQHYLTSHKEERGFLCSYCPKGFPRLSNLIKHQRTHTGERPYQCSHCSKSFTQLQILTRHERIHTGERPFLCSDCGKSFLSSGELSKHLQCHSDARPFPCPQCDKTFKANRFLKKHLQTHTGERPFSCSHCGKRFAKSTDLTRHNRMHTGERPHSCLQCGKSFLTYAEVVKHQRYHTGERPFKCTHCGKTFTQSCYLTVHVRIHTGERPYRCTVCGRSFYSTTPLRRHMLTHTGEKPFKCSECGKAYNRLHLLRSHKQSHAGNTC